jgi:hypothetical protein
MGEEDGTDAAPSTEPSAATVAATTEAAPRVLLPPSEFAAEPVGQGVKLSWASSPASTTSTAT